MEEEEEEEREYSRAHIAHCLRQYVTVRRDSTAVVTVGGGSVTGFQLVEGIHKLAAGLLEAGVCRDDVVAIAALNRYLLFITALAVHIFPHVHSSSE
jgi:long-subunit acyl-CoA synthetase (AMP-forming)